MTDSNVRDRLARRVDESLPRLIAVTQKLVTVASPNPPSDTAEIAAVVHELLAPIPGIEIERVEPEPRIINLVARVRAGRPGRRLIFNGHLDTFPIGEHLGWTVPPLGGVLREGRLYGRGVSDMKAGVACSILAATLLAEQRDAWSGEIVLTLAGDEENMGSLGTGYLLDRIPHARGDANICGDVGSPSVVRFGEKGLYWIEVEATGAPAHGAHVHKGISAIDRLRTALDQVKRLETLAVAAPQQVVDAIRIAAPVSEPISGAGEAAVLGRITVNIGTIAGGTSPNLVPVHAIARADIRLPVGVRTADLDAKLHEWISPIDGITWRVIRRFEPSFTDPAHEIVRRVTDVAEEVLGKRPAVNMRVGGSDSRWYRMHDVPTVVFGPTPYNMGGPDEYVVVDEIHAVAKVHTLAAFDYLAAQG
jgi:acetylornithine deacetylase/succinyl-diaminopimelate desuccinylase-like protein